MGELLGSNSEHIASKPLDPYHPTPIQTTPATSISNAFGDLISLDSLSINEKEKPHVTSQAGK